MANRWCLGIWPASLICACLLGVLNPVPQATAQTPGVCPQCADKQKALEAVPATAPTTHPFPVAACWQCERDAKRAQGALSNVLRDEAAVARARLRIFELRGWLSAHAGDQNTEAYKDNAKNLGDYERDLKDSEAKRVEDQRQLDELMASLASCNAKYKDKCKPPATTPLDGSPFSPLPEVRAECPDCEGLALKLEADIAELRRAELQLALDQNRLRVLLSTARTRDERKAIEKAEKDLENDLAVDKKAIEDIAQVIVNEFKALDECNKAHPSASCPPPAGRNMFPGGASAADARNRVATDDVQRSNDLIPARRGGAPGPAPPGGAGEPGAPPVPPPSLPGTHGTGTSASA